MTVYKRPGLSLSVARVPAPSPARAPVFRHDIQARGEGPRREVAAADIRSGEAWQGTCHHPRRSCGQIWRYETTLEPGAKPKKLARDLAYLKQIKDAFGLIGS